MSVAMVYPEHFWFLNTLVSVRIAQADGSDGISVLEHRAPYGDSPPLHVHHTEDEIFQIVEGTFRFQTWRWGAAPGAR